MYLESLYDHRIIDNSLHREIIKRSLDGNGPFRILLYIRYRYM